MWSFWLLTGVFFVVVLVKGVVAYRAERQHRHEKQIAEATLRQAKETVDRRHVTIMNSLSKPPPLQATPAGPSATRADPKSA